MIDKLEMFIAVATEGHFGRAAERLGISQPTLSSGIRQLEETLGVKLIFRGSRYEGLTPEGEAALVRARQIVGEVRQLRDEMRFTREGLSGPLRIAVIPTALTWSSGLVERFATRHPEVRFTVLSRNAAGILRMIDDLEIDAGISYLGACPADRFSRLALYREEYMLVCGPGSPFSGRRSVAWRELGGQKLSLLTPDMQNRRIIDENFREAGITPDVRIESNSTIVLATQVERSGWVTVLPADLALFLVNGTALEAVALEGGRTDHEVGLIARRQEPHTPMLRALLAEAGRISRIPCAAGA